MAKLLVPVSGDLQTAITTLRPEAPTINKVTRGLADCKKGVQGFFQWDASLTKFGDARGAVPRGNATIGAGSNSSIASPFEFAPKACAPGAPIPGRLATAADER
jgi:hypothetical protein